MLDFLTGLVHPGDILIAIVSFLGGKLLKDRRDLGLFFQVSLLLIRLAKHYFDTHPEAGKLAHKYKLKVNQLYHKYDHTSQKHSGALG